MVLHSITNRRKKKACFLTLYQTTPERTYLLTSLGFRALPFPCRHPPHFFVEKKAVFPHPAPMTSNPFAFLRRWFLGEEVSGLCGDGRGETFAVALESGDLVLFPLGDAGLEPQRLPAHDGPVLALVPDADDHAFLSGGADGRLLISEPGPPAPTEIARLSAGKITRVATSREGIRAFASETELRLLDPEGQPLGAALPLDEPLSCLAFSPGGSFLAASSGRSLRLFDPRTLQKTLLEKEAAVLSFVWRSDETRIYAALAGGGIEAWEVDPSLPAWSATAPLPFDGALPVFSSLVLSAGGRFLAACGARRPYVWSLEGAGGAPFLLGEEGPRRVCCAAAHPRDDLLAVGYDDGAVLLAPLDGRRELVVFPPAGSSVKGLVWGADGDSFHAALENGHVFLFTLRSVTRFVRGQAKR